MKKENSKNSKSSKRFYLNNQIRGKQVRCIDDQNNNLGLISKEQALELAREKNLDLVQINLANGIPLVKVIDYGKFKYDLSKRERNQAKKQREQASKVKEIKMRPSTDSHDVETKANKAKKFLEEGCKIKLSVQFKGREMAHKDVGIRLIKQFVELLPEISIIKEPSMEGKIISMMFESRQ